MRKWTYLILVSMIFSAGCANLGRKSYKIVLWSDVQKVMNNPYMVEEVLLEKYDAWPQRETLIIERANKKGDVLWIYEHVKWGRIAPGLNVRTIQCQQHHTEKERRRWLSYLSVDVGMYGSYLKLTKQRIPPEMMLSPKDARELYGKPSSDTVNNSGDGFITWSMVSEPPYNLRSNVRMLFRNGILTHIDFGELDNRD